MKTFQTVLACLALAGAGLAQATSSAPALSSTSPVQTRSIALDAPVITIQGLCEKSGAGSAPAADCKTVITRAEFEKLLNSGQPNLPDAQKRQLATQYAVALYLAQKAHQAGLDQGPGFDEKLLLIRLQLEASLGRGQVRKEAANVTNADVEAYYHDHISDYKTISYDRIYVPKQKKVDPAAQKANDPDLQKKREASQAEMKAEAGKLRARAAAGEDFSKLQQEAYDFGGYSDIKAANPRVEKVRKSGIPPADASIFELKTGEVSQVFADPANFAIYKIEASEDLPVANVRDEISRKLASDRDSAAMQSMQNSVKLDDAYFTPPVAAPASASPTLRNPGEAAPAPVPPTSAPGKK